MSSGPLTSTPGICRTPPQNTDIPQSQLRALTARENRNACSRTQIYSTDHRPPLFHGGGRCLWRTLDVAVNLREPDLTLRTHISLVCFQSTRCQFFCPRPQGCARNFYFLRNPVIQLPFVGPVRENEGCACSTSPAGSGLPGKGLQATRHSATFLCSS